MMFALGAILHFDKKHNVEREPQANQKNHVSGWVQRADQINP